MNRSFNKVKENKEIIIEEKASKFIANIYYIENEEEAKNILLSLKKKYKDARHIVYACKTVKKQGEYIKYTDDGEPQGTAGLQILKILEVNDLNNCLITVVRYFGGTLLGTGLLSRTYMAAASKVVEEANIVKVVDAFTINLVTDYANAKHVKKLIIDAEGELLGQDFTDNVGIQFVIETEKFVVLENNLKENNLEYRIIAQRKSYK
ncbi:MAG: YigZ family protein [Clostridia bacterium]